MLLFVVFVRYITGNLYNNVIPKMLINFCVTSVRDYNLR